jgi:hypothetical protein
VGEIGGEKAKEMENWRIELNCGEAEVLSK